MLAVNQCKGLSGVSFATLRRSGVVLLLAALLGCEPGQGEANRLERPVTAVYSSGAASVFVLYREAGKAGGPPQSGIARLSLDGRVEQRHWRDGFGPEAVLVARGEGLYVGDGGELWHFDARTGAELGHISLDHARLTDIAVDEQGLVHVLDQRKGQVLRIAGNRAVHLPLPAHTRPIAILHGADALWILLAEPGRNEQILLRRSFEDEERLCRLSPASDQTILINLERDRIGLFDPQSQRLRRFDRECRELLHWRIAAGPVRLAPLPGDRLAIPEPQHHRVSVMATPDRLLADAPRQFE